MELTLTRPSLDDLKKVSVMIRCRGTESQGSGTIVCVNDTLYVLTAAHVISISDNNCYKKEEIRITAAKGTCSFKVKEVAYYDYNQDCAVLEVSNEDSFSEEPLKHVRILKHAPNGEGILCGFGKDEQEVEMHPFKQVSDTKWEFQGYDVTQQNMPAKKSWGGFSGGGIFYKGENGLYLSCYIKGLGYIDGTNNKFVCYPAMNFTSCKPLQEIIVDVPVKYVSDEGLIKDFESDKSLPHFLTSPPPEANSNNVIGREKDLNKLWKLLSEKQRVMLTGFGGIGKTKLAQLLFHEYESHFDEVAWIDYQGKLRKSFLACINDPRFREGNYLNEKERWDAINSTLANDGKKKLIIIDNVNGDTKQHPRQDKELKNLTGWKDTMVLLTSRLDRLGGFQKTKLKELTEDCCIDLFYHYFGNTKPAREIVAKIVELANMHTFTIELLAKGAEREDFEKYYERLIENGFGEVTRIVDTEHHLEETTIEKHLRILFDMQGRSDEDKKVLNSFAVLPEYCRCSMEEIQEWFGFGNADLDQVIRDGWLTFNEDDQRYYIHSLVRTIVRFDFGEDERKNKVIAPQGIADPLLAYLESNNDWHNINYGFAFVQRYVGITESSISSFARKETEQIATLYNDLGFCYKSIGEYDKSLVYYKKAIAVRESKLGKEHVLTAMTYNNIGGTYKDIGNYEKALEYYKKAQKIREYKLGKNHPDTAGTYNEIALTLYYMGNYEEALKYYKMALVIRESKLGKNHPDTAETYHNLAKLYKAQGVNDEALEYYKKTLIIYEDKLGKDHPNTATTYNNLAGLYTNMSDYDKAMEYYEKAKIIRESKLGKKHPDTATTYNDMAVLYFLISDYNRALEYCNKAKEIDELKLGKDHPYTATVYNNIARAYKVMIDYDKALGYYLLALKIWLKKDVNHPNAKRIFGNLYDCYAASKKKKPFEEWLIKQLNEKEYAALLELVESKKDEEL